MTPGSRMGANAGGDRPQPDFPFARTRKALFLAAGVALPFYAFPPFSVSGKALDLATLAAAAFVVSSAASALAARRRPSARAVVLAFAFAVVPLLALIPPLAERFVARAFEISYLHWLLVAAFFLAATSLEFSEKSRSTFLAWIFAVPLAISFFGLYQMVGHPHGWAGTGARLFPFQRQPFAAETFGDFGEFLRPTSVFLEPAWLGGYLAWVLVLAAAELASDRPGRVSKALAPFVIVIGGLTVVATVSVGSYADVGAGGLLLLPAIVRRGSFRRLRLWLAGAAVCAVLVGVVTPFGAIFTRAISLRVGSILSASKSSAGARPALPDSSWVRARNVAETARVFRERPLRGIGLGQFFGSFPLERRDPVVVAQPWCGWVTIAAQMGFLGPILLASALAFAMSRRAFPANAAARSPVAAALIAVAVVQQIHTASFIDLWWWYPVCVAAIFASSPERADAAAPAPAVS